MGLLKLKPHHTNSLRLIMSSSRFFLPTHSLFLSPTPLKPRSSLGVRTLFTNRVLVPTVLVPPRCFMSSSSSSSASVTEVRKKGKEGLDNYASENIQILEGLDAVRKRPGMYIGSTGFRGLHHLVYEILDNAVDEAQAGFASKVDIEILADGSVCITDNGRGIPIDLHPGSKKSGVETVLTVLHAGGKFGGASSGYKVSGGLHGVGLSVVNALSENLEVTVWRDSKECHQSYTRGKPHQPLACKDLPHQLQDRTGTSIKFWPDSQIFTSGMEFDYDTIAARVRERAFLVPGLTITLKKEDSDPEKNRYDEYCFAGGLVEYVKWLNADKFMRFTWICVIRCSDAYSDTMLGYANSIRTVDGGTHIDGIKASLTRTINNLGKKSKLIKEKDISLSGEHVREGLTSVISVKLPNPEFEGQTKAAQAAKRARELERQKSVLKVSSLPGKLADCSATDPEKAEIFIVEGDSAGGSAKQGRDKNFQAILPLKGKILNVERKDEAAMYNNAEIQSLIRALGLGVKGEDFKKDGLRYHKIIILTDADVDGAHIRTLLLTFFYRYQRALFDEGCIYVGVPPLYKVERGKQAYYCYDDAELKKLQSSFPSNAAYHIQRFKGLGEMMPTQLWETTLDPKTRLLKKLVVEDAAEANVTFSSLMGARVDVRKEMIQKTARKIDLKHLDI
ncbi:hypothetical protein M8C21_029379 [Ambrosia artemisiifolia]|uniref:DNA topoisomerase 2 n=1 Tax=Ambrosia artemisiifolia TaxID=4212 RepID=A0AAD5CCW3_AMBAR|nr:hypothetical protein M8C21_029379 [Ambrosia artemisiifolia]